MAQMVKRLPANSGDLGSIPGLGRSLEKGMATHSIILAWRIPWTEEPGGLQSMGSQESDTTGQLSLSVLFASNILPVCLCSLSLEHRT